MLNWEALDAACHACQACPLHETRTNVVFGVGSHQAELLFIGEGPGEREDLTGEPFVGPAGKLLDEYLNAVGISREEVYMVNNNGEYIPCEAEFSVQSDSEKAFSDR